MCRDLGDPGEEEIDRPGGLVLQGRLPGTSRNSVLGRGEGGAVCQVVVAVGQLTKCKDLFKSIVSRLEAKDKIKPRLDFLGS